MLGAKEKNNRKGKERNRNSHPKIRRHQENTKKNFGTKKNKKNAITDFKKSMVVLNSRMERTEERVCECRG